MDCGSPLGQLVPSRQVYKWKLILLLEQVWKEWTNASTSLFSSLSLGSDGLKKYEVLNYCRFPWGTCLFLTDSCTSQGEILL